MIVIMIEIIVVIILNHDCDRGGLDLDSVFPFGLFFPCSFFSFHVRLIMITFLEGKSGFRFLEIRFIQAHFLSNESDFCGLGLTFFPLATVTRSERTRENLKAKRKRQSSEEEEMMEDGGWRVKGDLEVRIEER